MLDWQCKETMVLLCASPMALKAKDFSGLGQIDFLKRTTSGNGTPGDATLHFWFGGVLPRQLWQDSVSFFFSLGSCAQPNGLNPRCPSFPACLQARCEYFKYTLYVRARGMTGPVLW
jgi:hypothetical protein